VVSLAVPFAIAVFRLVRESPLARGPRVQLRQLVRPESVPLLILLAAGLSPYVGLRTEASFSMFSNLRTEGAVNNHLFMPHWHLFGYEDDLVEIIRTTSRDLEEQSRGGLLVRAAFQDFLLRALDRGEDFEVEYRRLGGEVRSVPSIRELEPELRAVPYLQRKILYFRPVPPDGRCVH